MTQIIKAKWQEDSDRVTTLKLSKEEFARLDHKLIPSDWAYTQVQGIHIMKKVWILNFEEIILERKMTKDQIYNHSAGNFAIAEQEVQKGAFRNATNLAKGTQSEKLAKVAVLSRDSEKQRNAESLVANKVCKNIAEAIKMLTPPVIVKPKEEKKK